MTEALKPLTYVSVVSQERVQIALMILALNDLEVKTSDIQNVFLTVPSEGKTAIIIHASYGLASAGASF